jgi:hypothetical protein
MKFWRLQRVNLETRDFLAVPPQSERLLQNLGSVWRELPRESQISGEGLGIFGPTIQSSNLSVTVVDESETQLKSWQNP